MNCVGAATHTVLGQNKLQTYTHTSLSQSASCQIILLRDTIITHYHNTNTVELPPRLVLQLCWSYTTTLDVGKI